MDFDATVSHSTAISEDKSISPKTEWGYASTKHRIHDLVNAFNHQSFTNRSANLRGKLYTPDDWIYQHIPVREKVGKTGVNSLRNGKLTHTTALTLKKVLELVRKIMRFIKEWHK